MLTAPENEDDVVAVAVCEGEIALAKSEGRFCMYEGSVVVVTVVELFFAAAGGFVEFVFASLLSLLPR